MTRDNDGSPPDRILIVKLADLGDALLATPAIRALRREFPGACIDALTTSTGAAVFELCPEIDRVIRFPKTLFDRPAGMARPGGLLRIVRLAIQLRVAGYDAIVLFHHLTTEYGANKFRALCRAAGAPIRAGLDNGRGHFLTHRAIDHGFGVRTEWQYGLEVAETLGVPITADERPRLKIPDDAIDSADRLLGKRQAGVPTVVIHPSTGWFSKVRNWPAMHFAEIARRLQADHGARVVVVGASDAAPAAAAVLSTAKATNLVGRTSLAELAAVLREADLVIGADSGVAHLAAAVDASTLVIFGPSNHEAWRPYGAEVYTVGGPNIPDTRAVIIRSNLPCSPCFYTGYSLGRPQGCGLPTCLDLVSVPEVLRVASHMLARTRHLHLAPMDEHR